MFRKVLRSDAIHQKHCLACRLFGSLAMKGRASVRDLFPFRDGATGEAAPGGENQRRANDLEGRPGVSIDRVTGSVKHGPFDLEMVPAGVSFWGEIALENYQAYQLGLLAQAFDALNDGFAQLGSSKSRGLGVARIALEGLLHEQVPQPDGAACGVGRLAPEGERRAYGLLPDRALGSGGGVRRGLFDHYALEETARARAFLEAGIAALGALR